MGNDYQDTQGGAIPDSDSGRVRALEARYIELLEKRITHLEAVVAQHEREVRRLIRILGALLTLDRTTKSSKTQTTKTALRI
jgi:hypothetical protein